MSCFSAMTTTTGGRGTYYYSSSPGRPRGGGGGKRPWRRWRAKCAGIAAAVGSRLRRSVVRAVDGGRRRTPPPSSSSVHRGWCHHQHHGRQSFAPVYVDDLYSHSLQPAAKAHRGVVVQQEQVHEPPSTSARDKLPATDAAAAAAPAHGASASGNRQQARAMAAGVAAMRNVLLRSPGRGGGGVLGVVKGMGEVDLRAELFIRKFKEDMRLQSQRSAEELQAMLARGL